jgi:hypothetical protein
LNAFCTLFDSRYFSRGVAMCESLLRHWPQARIYLFAFDDLCRRASAALALPNVTVIPFEALEQDGRLREARATRGWVEYLWTCSSATTRHVLEHYGEQACTYADADIYFFASPEPLLEEVNGYDVMITEHRFTPTFDQSATSGVYNVQFMPFRNSPQGRAILDWWLAACLESCELNPAQGKCGDQKYLDDWTTRFPGVRVMQHLGGGVAPWNVQQYRFAKRDGRPVGIEVATGKKFDLIFYHFHGFKLTGRRNVHPTALHYPLTRDVVDLIYTPYVRHLMDVGERVRSLGFDFDPHGSMQEPAPSLRDRLRSASRRFARMVQRPSPTADANRVYHTSEL